MPLHDLPLEQFLTPGAITGNKTPRKHKRPLSPSRTTPLNPAKRRVLDAEGISLSTKFVSSSPVPFMFSNMHTVTPTRPSRLGNGLTRNHQATASPLSLHRCSPSRDLYPKPAIESSTDPQSRHYPGFDILRDSEQRRGSSVPRLSSPFDGDVQVDRSDEDKENVPVRKKAKKQYPKKRLLSGPDGLDSSYLGAFAQMNKVVRPERTPFAVRQAMR